MRPWLEPLGHFPAGGRTPRDIAFTPDGAFLLIASQDDHLIRALRIGPNHRHARTRRRVLRAALARQPVPPAALNRKPST